MESSAKEIILAAAKTTAILVMSGTNGDLIRSVAKRIATQPSVWFDLDSLSAAKQGGGPNPRLHMVDPAKIPISAKVLYGRAFNLAEVIADRVNRVKSIMQSDDSSLLTAVTLVWLVPGSQKGAPASGRMLEPQFLKRKVESLLHPDDQKLFRMFSVTGVEELKQPSKLDRKGGNHA